MISLVDEVDILLPVTLKTEQFAHMTEQNQQELKRLLQLAAQHPVAS